MTELTEPHVAILERVISRGFVIVAFPLYGNAVGVRKQGYAALLDPLPNGGFRLLGEPCLLLDGNLTVRVTREGRSWFVWKQERLEATPERIEGVKDFARELTSLIEPRV